MGSAPDDGVLLLPAGGGGCGCGQAKLCGDDGVSVRWLLLVVLALEVLMWPRPPMRDRVLMDEPPEVELERVGWLARWDFGCGSTW